MSESLNHSFDQFVRFIQEQNSQYWNGSAVALFETIFKQKQIKYLATLCLKYKLLQINLICIKLNDVSSVTQSYCVLITLITSQKDSRRSYSPIIASYMNLFIPPYTVCIKFTQLTCKSKQSGSVLHRR